MKVVVADAMAFLALLTLGCPAQAAWVNLLRGSADGKKPGRRVQPLSAPSLAQYGDAVALQQRVQQRQPAHVAIQEKCDKIAEMGKAKANSEEVRCDAVILEGTAPFGCECHFLGEGQACPFDCSGPNHMQGCVDKEVMDMGFGYLFKEGGSGGGHAGPINIAVCMYSSWKGYPFHEDPQYMKEYQKTSMNNVLTWVKAVEDRTDAWKKNLNWMWGATLPPWPVDKYGTHNCFGRCTTADPVVWARYTSTTPAPE